MSASDADNFEPRGAEQGYFGRLNEIYFYLERGKIASVADRARRAKVVPFVERLIGNVSNSKGYSLHASSLSGLLGDTQSNRKEVVRAGFSFEVIGDSLQIMELDGRSLTYDTLELAAEQTRAILTFGVPTGCVLEIESPLFDNSHTEADNLLNLSVDVRATDDWARGGGLLRFDCSEREGEISFIFESIGSLHPVSPTAIICAPGRELDAVLARAALGSEFVAALVLPHPVLWKDALGFKMLDRAVILPSTPPEGVSAPDLVFGDSIKHSAPVREALGLVPRKRTVVAPQTEELLGPALAIAIACDAELQLKPDATSVQLQESEKTLFSWNEESLIGKVMPDLGEFAIDELVTDDELVLCESSKDGLLVIQAVGYAASHHLPIAFLKEEENANIPEVATFEAYRDRAERMVPPPLRAPSQPKLTIFTSNTPLHLVRRSESAVWPDEYWATTHTVSHLPGQAASVLIPRWYSDEIERVAPLPLSIFYNGLGSQGAGDSLGFAASADRLLNHTLTLGQDAAKTEVLRETLQRIPASILLIAAHGAERSIELERGRLIGDTEIADWHLAGSPVVINNSCSSWTQLGQAFLNAGARAYVGTLWEIAHEPANDVATGLLKHMLAVPNEGIAHSLAGAIGGGLTAKSLDHGSYIYVGLPQASARIDRPHNRNERLETAALALHVLYEFLHSLIDDGRARIARYVQPSIHDTVVAGFSGLIEPDDPFPPPLPSPFVGTVLDLGFVVGTADIHALRRMVIASPTEQQEALIRKCLSTLNEVTDDLSSRSERYQEFQASRSAEAGIVGGFSNTGFKEYRLLVSTAFGVVLPLAKNCCDVSMFEEAEDLVALASIMVTIRPDLEAGTPPSPMTVLRRIRQGVLEKAQIYGTDEAVEIDRLDNSVNRSELANRFGIALRGLGHEASATSFFELAMELTSRGSTDESNAKANLWRDVNPLGQLPQLFHEQLAAEDWGNAGITGGNLLRAAGAARQTLSVDLLAKIEALPDQIPGVEARASAECLLLGSLAVYHAGLERLEEAKDFTEQIGNRLLDRLIRDPGGLSGATVSARALFEYLHENGSFALACEEGAKVANRLSRAELHEEALRMHFAIGASAIEGYSATESNRFLKAFAVHSALAGRLVQDRPTLADDLRDMVDWMTQNTTCFWHQAESNGQTELAVLAYEAQRFWPTGITDTAWELLRAARSEQNMKTVRAQAATGDLRRSATIEIEDNLSVSAEITTLRSAADAPTIISIWPLSSHLHSFSHQPKEARIAARKLMTTLAPGDQSIVREVGLSHLRGDGRGAYLYSAICGSTTISYTLLLRLPARLLPQKALIEGVKKSAVAIDLRFVLNGSELRITPIQDDIRWFGRLKVFCFDVGATRLPFTATDGPFGDWIPVALFESIMEIIARKQDL